MRKVLPEKWCVKADETKIVQKYFLYLPNASKDYITHKNYEGRYFNYPMPSSGVCTGAYSSSFLHEEYEELTMEEFKRLVLHVEDNDPIVEFLN